MSTATEWRVCPTCPPDDNEWPADEFFAGMARCKACYTEQKKLAQELKAEAETPEERARIRKARGICQECPHPVQGTVGRSLYCAACNRRRRLAKDQRRWRRDPEFRARKLARKRELHAERMANDPEYRERYRRRRQRERLLSYPGRERYMETQRRHNSDPERQQRKREHALRRYYEIRPERPKPVCATCSEPIPYDGKGAPPKYHQTVECNPWIRREARAA